MFDQILKYVLESGAVAVALYFIGGRTMTLNELLLATATITVTFIVLDLFAPSVSSGVRQGAGFGLGLGQVQVGGMTDPIALDYYKNSKLPKVRLESDGNRVQVDGLYNPLLPIRVDEEGIEKRLQMSGPKLKMTSVGTAPNNKYMAANHPQVSLPHQIDVIERFMDDKVALNYYSKGKLPKPNPGASSDIFEWFESRVTNDKVQSIEPFQDETGIAGAANSADVAEIDGMDFNPTQGVTGPIPQDGHKSRLENTVYSGDLVQFQSSKGQFSHPGGAKLVKISNNPKGLFKLRVQLATGHVSSKMMPIRYGDKVKLCFNTSDGEVRHLKANGFVSVSDTDETDSESFFEIVNSIDPSITDVINFDDEVLIRKPSAAFLMVDNSSKIQTSAAVEGATRFKLLSQKGCGPLWRFSLP